jgi:hypothetical protein
MTEEPRYPASRTEGRRSAAGRLSRRMRPSFDPEPQGAAASTVEDATSQS